MENLRDPRVLGTQYRVYDKDGKYKRTIDKTDEKNYNNGICSICNEKLDLFDIEYHRGSGDEYYYKCKNNHLVRTSHHFE